MLPVAAFENHGKVVMQALILLESIGIHQMDFQANLASSELLPCAFPFASRIAKVNSIRVVVFPLEQ